MNKVNVNINRYNTKVRIAMSEKYRECSVKKNDLRRRLMELEERLLYEKSVLPYNKYIELMKYKDSVEKEYENARVELNIWDQAREVCIEAADNIL